MRARDKSRFTTAQAGWIALAVFGGWLVFLLVPVPHKVEPVKSTTRRVIDAEPWYEMIPGVDRNPDWAGLPGYFAIWADQLDWKDDRTRFAYWNPGSQSYSYYFEAVRHQGNYRFRPLTRREMTQAQFYYVDADNRQFAHELSEQGPGTVATHPFVFFKNPDLVEPVSQSRPDKGVISGPPPPTVKIDLLVEKIAPPPPPPPTTTVH